MEENKIQTNWGAQNSLVGRLYSESPLNKNDSMAPMGSRSCLRSRVNDESTPTLVPRGLALSRSAPKFFESTAHLNGRGSTSSLLNTSKPSTINLETLKQNASIPNFKTPISAFDSCKRRKAGEEDGEEKLAVFGEEFEKETDEMSEGEEVKELTHPLQGSRYEEEEDEEEKEIVPFLESLNLPYGKLKEIFGGTFVYLIPKRGDPCASAYNLEIVRHDEVDTVAGNYFTLSKEGVTFFRGRESEFSSLEQYEREYMLFHSMSKIHFFKLYRRWKAFTVWKKGVMNKKVLFASEALTANLFSFVPVLRRALLNIKTICVDLQQEMLVNISCSKTPIELSHFLSLQKDHQDSLAVKMVQFSETVKRIARSSCDEVVDDFLRANNIIPDHKMTFMERASLRSECRKLTRFLRLVDLVIVDSLRELSLESTTKLADYFTLPTDLTPHILYDDSKSEEDVQANRILNHHQVPLFKVHADFNDAGDVEFSPSSSEISTSFQDLIFNMLNVISIPEKVFSDPEMGVYIMTDTNEEEGGGGEEVPLNEIISTDEEFRRQSEVILRSISAICEEVESYIQVFTPFKDIYFENSSYVDNVTEMLGQSDVEVFSDSIALYKGQSCDFATIPNSADIFTILVNSRELKEKLLPSP